MLAHHGCWPITQSYGVTVCNETKCDARGWPQLVVRRAVQTDPTLLRYAPAITEQKKCLELLAEKIDRFQPLRTCNKVGKRTQYIKSNNVGSCWPTKLRPFSRGLSLFFKEAPDAHPFTWKCDFAFAFPYVWLCNTPRFEKEAKSHLKRDW